MRHFIRSWIDKSDGSDKISKSESGGSVVGLLSEFSTLESLAGLGLDHGTSRKFLAKIRVAFTFRLLYVFLLGRVSSSHP